MVKKKLARAASVEIRRSRNDKNNINKVYQLKRQVLLKLELLFKKKNALQ